MSEHDELFSEQLVLLFVLAVLLGQGQECFFEAGAYNFKARESGIAREQFADDRFRLDGVKFDGFAIFLHFCDARNLTQSIYAEAGDTSDPLAGGFRLDFRRSSLRDDLALI